MADALGIQKTLEFIQAVNSSVNEVVDALSQRIPEGTVKVGGLFWDKFEMTELVYKQITGKSPSSNGDNMPVTNVTWYDAKAACEKMRKRLPTGDEWQAAAGPGDFATHDGKLVDSYGNKNANFDSQGPMNVGSFLPNSNGLCDMTGNVWEWVSDGNGFKGIFGGSFYGNDVGGLRVAFRNGQGDPDKGSIGLGFRCVMGDVLSTMERKDVADDIIMSRKRAIENAERERILQAHEYSEYSKELMNDLLNSGSAY